MKEALQFPDGVSFRVQGVNVTMHILNSKIYSRFYEMGRFYEQDFLSYISRLGIPGTYLDIGSNLGNHAVYFGLFTKATKVIAFEPLPQNFAVIKKNIEVNGLTEKIFVNLMALSDTEGQQILEFDDIKESTLFKRLDNIETDDDISIMKVDVEGMEPNVLLGSLETIQRNRPLIYLECKQEESMTVIDDEEIMRILSRLGYISTGRVFGYTPLAEYCHQDKIEDLEQRVQRTSVPFSKKTISHSCIEVTDSMDSMIVVNVPQGQGEPCDVILFEDFPISKDYYYGIETEAYKSDPEQEMHIYITANNDDEIVYSQRYFLSRRHFIHLKYLDNSLLRVTLSIAGAGSVRVKKCVVNKFLR